REEDTEPRWRETGGGRKGGGGGGGHVDYVADPKYSFGYEVADHKHGDFHGQEEKHDGKTVHGVYSLKEPGGNIRTVKYYVDKSGFHADVHNSGGNDHSGGGHGGGHGGGGGGHGGGHGGGG
ncbi:unnamed protein product, partial [Timema podura]|nr:unnamed protein product [Timema podura]